VEWREMNSCREEKTIVIDFERNRLLERVGVEKGFEE